MPSDGDLRQPYGPGWEDPDWTPFASEFERVGVSASDSPATLGQFMDTLRRVAIPTPAANAKRLERHGRPRSPVSAGQTRRWVVATGASLLAAGTFALPRPARPAEATMRPSSTASPSGATRSPAEDDEGREQRLTRDRP